MVELGSIFPSRGALNIPHLIIIIYLKKKNQKMNSRLTKQHINSPRNYITFGAAKMPIKHKPAPGQREKIEMERNELL